jgi:shikimate kinase
MKTVVTIINGGLSVLSAFANGHGASVAIDLPMKITMRESGESNYRFKELISIIQERYNISTPPQIEIVSMIPQGMGLKSSSAMVSGVLLSLNKIFKIFQSEQQIAVESSHISKLLKISFTGAFDDNCTCIFGGLCYTDNNEKILLKRSLVEEKVVIIIPGNHERSSFDIGKTDFSKYMVEFNDVEEMVVKGKFLEAMKANGEIFMDILGRDSYTMESIEKTHPLICGQSGKGPAIFAVFDNGDEAMRACENLKRLNLSPIKTHFTNKPAKTEEIYEG